ncbi:mechanosensitive ion channel family protein [Natronobeatus ordinarius]|uniref:mechanosensitive ion channel family protein n=1 Tax=Natronobeatus ordinarius TaxID=2963433 RepID=UPI0020CD7F43|nr:mechanosensitive ion channel family protein [Natronobeatus ordinarius]
MRRSVLGQTPESMLVDDVLEALEASWVLALLALIVAWYGSKLLTERVRPALEERVLRPTTANAVLLVARAGIVLFALVPFAGLFGFRPQNVLLSFTVISIVVGAMLAPVARSYISGLFILLNRPYEVGDVVELVDRGERGYVDDVTLGYTKVFTLENSFLVVPNETMRERDVRNLSAEDERGRISIEVCVTYEGDLERARELLEATARDVDGVVEGGPPIRIGDTRYPAEPTALVREFADHGVVLELRFWIEQPSRTLPIQSAVRAAVWTAFEDADVEFAYPHTHHVFDETSGRARLAFDRESGRAAPTEREEEQAAD